MAKSKPKTTSAESEASSRIFKTAWFAKEARKAKISDSDLCKAIGQIMQGQADDLGGGVYKKRLNDNMHRSIVLAKAGRYWVYAFLYAKKDRENIEPDELAGFKELAKYYAAQTEKEIAIELKNEDLLEICHGC